MGLLCAQTGAPLGSGACLAGSAGGCVYCGIDPALPAAELSDDELFADLRGVFDAIDPVPPAALPDPAVLARAATRRLDSAVGGPPVPSAADLEVRPAVSPPGHRLWRPSRRLLERLTVALRLLILPPSLRGESVRTEPAGSHPGDPR